jgi:hypothetical protein
MPIPEGMETADEGLNHSRLLGRLEADVAWLVRDIDGATTLEGLRMSEALRRVREYLAEQFDGADEA